jgi:SAM-dependent methyltransferase
MVRGCQKRAGPSGEPVTNRIDFSANASAYDDRHGAAIPDEEADRLWTAARLGATARVLDIGAGTGRVAIPLARRGCTVVGVEPARGMLTKLRTKADRHVLAVAADGSHLPFSTGRFDAVIVARLLYLTEDWRAILAESDRVLAAGGCLLHQWANGTPDEEWVQLREEARRLFVQAGITAPFHPGVRSEKEVDTLLQDLGLLRDGEIDVGPGPAITLREFLRRVIDGELSYIWNLPEEVRAESLPQLQRWSEGRFDLERLTPMPRDIRWTIYRKRG